jgi:ABC-2 type transport system ATP-binding protein
MTTRLLGEPEVLVGDEPANGLDPGGITWLRQYLRAFADRGGTVLVSSHLLAEVAQTVDDVVIIAGGRLVTQSSLAQLSNRSRSAIRVRTPRWRRCAMRSHVRASPPSWSRATP